MKQVKKRYGKPPKVILPKGHFSKHRPPITRWVYDSFIVYFEKTLVIHSARPHSLKILKQPKEQGSAQKPTLTSVPEKDTK